MWIFSSSILLLSISFIGSVPLDGACNQVSLCDNDRLECRDGRCECKTPWYTPCNSTCVPANRVSYEGDRCEVLANCVPNTVCQNNRCDCANQFTPRNGLCFKTLNATCSGNDECWSGFCENQRCRCRDAFDPDEDSYGCVPRLVKVYSNLASANQARELCSDSLQCVTSLATCVNENNSTSKFCKCPQGYNVAAGNENCEPIESQLFSPLTTQPSTYGECGTCRDPNAFCTTADRERTCWCRSGFEKVGERCERITRFRPLLIFPSLADTSAHDFASACDSATSPDRQINSAVCTCAPGYRFQRTTAACIRIEPGNRQNVLEYGVCTRITSSGAAISHQGLCPNPTTCVASRDKHVCSCGADQFVNTENNNTCTYFVGSNAGRTNGTCPLNSARNASSGICQCNRGYAPRADNRRCVLTLSSLTFDANCTRDTTGNTLCASQFGRKAQYCSLGECRCSGEQSFPNNGLGACYAPLNQTLTQPFENCPPNTVFTNNRCTCSRGYRATADGRSCSRLSATLTEFQATPSASNAGDWNIDDCRALYTGPVEVFASGQCQCREVATVNDQRDGCWYKLDQNLPNQQEAAFCPPNSTPITAARCQCQTSYRPENNRCVPFATRVYNRDDPDAVNVTGITNTVCSSTFGVGSEKSPRGDFCVCKEDAFPVANFGFCHFYLDRPTSNLKTQTECPDKAEVIRRNNNQACVCLAGYRTAPDNRTCVVSSVNLVGTLQRTSANAANCTQYSNDDCTVKFGNQAFCREDKCYCDRRLSYLTNGRCNSYASYIFPAEHELSDHACSVDRDCGNRANVICGTRPGSSYKVCQCNHGYFLNPATQTCDNQRCVPACDSARNFECSGYQCVCKEGFNLRNGVCERNPELTIYRTCNTSLSFLPAGNNLVCDRTCQRALCPNNLKTEDDRCASAQLEDDRCLYRGNICSSADPNAICSIEENQCVCRASYYRYDDECARAVDSPCEENSDCGGEMLCTQNRCVCNPDQDTETTTDVFGRTIQYCKKNGDTKMHMNAFILLFATFLKFYFC